MAFIDNSAAALHKGYSGHNGIVIERSAAVAVDGEGDLVDGPDTEDVEVPSSRLPALSVNSEEVQS